MGPSSVSPRPLCPRRRRQPHHQDVRATFMFMCGFSSACWCSCWRCSSSPSTGWRTLSPPLPPSLTAAAREGAPSPTWRSAASHLRGPPSPHCPPEGGSTHRHMGIVYVQVHFLMHACNNRQVCTDTRGPATPHCDKKHVSHKGSMALHSMHVYSNPTGPVSLLFSCTLQKHRRLIAHNVMKRCWRVRMTEPF